MPKLHRSWKCFCITVLFLSLCGCIDNVNAENKFVGHDFSISDFGLFDLGVVDIDNDGHLDVFTVNHSGRQSLLLNTVNGFQDIYQTIKMDQDPFFPGMMVTPDEPPLDKKGVYINWRGPDIITRTHRLKDNEKISGRIEILSSVVVKEKKKISLNIETESLQKGVTRSVIHFNGTGEGYFVFKPYIHALPIRFIFEEKVEADGIFVGVNKISPDSRDFTIQMKDRHGMAWFDYNNDSKKDVFITRGGLKGTMRNIPLEFWDELLINTQNGMVNLGTQKKLNKDGCPGRQAAWIDYNSDGKMDIYVSCGREKKNASFSNLLFKQLEDDTFSNVAVSAGLNLESNGTFVWMNADQDNDMDLFLSDRKGFVLYRNESGKFKPEPIETQTAYGQARKLSLADYDNDGDIDIFSASPKGNALLISDSGKFHIVDPKLFGMPERSLTANWVDFNNDGMIDLHAIPGGIYRQNNKRRFLHLQYPQPKQSLWFPYQLADARAIWFDKDNNGTLDVLMAGKYVRKKTILAKIITAISGEDSRLQMFSYFWETSFLYNKNSENHWVQVQVAGPPSNPQSIGARVTVETPDIVQIQQVGQFEGSHYSQGHYRLYFGLGSHTHPTTIHVKWQDGKVREIRNPPGDTIVNIFWKDEQ